MTEEDVMKLVFEDGSSEMRAHQMKCPRCNRDGIVVCVSKDKKQVGIRCPASHNLGNRDPSKYGSTVRLKSRPKRVGFIKQI